jgi:hypothetical protein
LIVRTLGQASGKRIDDTGSEGRPRLLIAA